MKNAFTGLAAVAGFLVIVFAAAVVQRLLKQKRKTKR